MIAMVFGFLHRFWLKMRIAGAWSARFVSRAFTSLFACAIALMIMLALGVIMGYIGYKADIAGLEEAGQLMFALGGMIAVLVCGVFYLKAVLATHTLSALDEILGKLTFGRVKNIFTHETGKDIRHELLNVFAWVAAFCAYAVIFPVYKTLLSIPVAVIFAVFFAAASSNRWPSVETRVGKIIVFSAIMAAFVFFTADVCVAGAMGKWARNKGDIAAVRFNSWIAADDGREDILEERVTYEEARAKVRVAEYRRLRSKQIALASHGKDNSDEFRRNATRMRELERGPRPAKVVGQTSTETGNGHAASPMPITLGIGADKLTGWISSHWGWILIWTLVVFLLILFFVGLATRQKWLAMTALAGILLLGFLGAGSWIMGHTRVQSAPVVMLHRQARAQGAVQAPHARAKCRPGLRAEIEDIGRNLDALAAQ